MGCLDEACDFEAVEARDILLHVQNVHNNGREVKYVSLKPFF